MEEKQDKITGHKIIRKLEQMLVGFEEFLDEGGDPDDWNVEFIKMLEKSDDKMLAYRRVLLFAEAREAMFRTLAATYTKHARTQKNIQTKIKYLAVLHMRHRKEIDGATSLELSDGTSASYVESPSYEFKLEGDERVDALDYPNLWPDGFEKTHAISKSKAIKAAKLGQEIEGIQVIKTTTESVRWR